MDREFFRTNRQRLLNEMPDRSIAMLFAGRKRYRSADSMYRYTPDRNYYYLTGLSYPDGVTVLGRTKGEPFEISFVNRASPEMEKLWGKVPAADECADITGIRDIRYLDQLDRAIADLLRFNRFEYIYADSDKMEIVGEMKDADMYIARLRNAHAHLRVMDLGRVIGNLRRHKTSEEIECMRTACRETAAGMERLVRRIRPGGYTYELRAEFEYYLTSRGMEGSIFPPVITSGANINYLHYIPDSMMSDGELVLVDLGAEYKYYGADICRVYPVNGRFTPEQRMWYELLLGVYRETLASIRPGVTLREIGDIGKRLLVGRLKANKTIRDDSELRKYLNHGIAHFLGMDNHDPGEDCELETGMLMALEPGLYFKDLGFGMRMEDSILITEQGNEVLTDALALDVETIEDMLTNCHLAAKSISYRSFPSGAMS